MPHPTEITATARTSDAHLQGSRPALRVATAGSVDDGKSTLIGRLLFDCKALMTDQIEHVERASRRRGLGRADLALLTDGLRAEREQGITIDVAFRYFVTPRRRFVLADAPGHVEYTRNMAVAASQADAAVVLVDARRGVVEQTRRHLTVARLLGVPTLVVAVNKMDQVGFELEAFARVRDDVGAFLRELEHTLADASGPRVEPLALHVLPLSALHGDNVVEPSARLAWYDGRPLLGLLEDLPMADALARAEHGARMAVQWVIRPQTESHPDYRGYAGRVASGVVRVGDAVTVLPSGVRSAVRALETARGPATEAAAGTSVVRHLAADVDASRGDWIATGAPPELASRVEADVVWLGERPLRPQARYLLKQGSRTLPSRFAALARYDIASGRRAAHGEIALGPNDLACATLEVGSALVIEPDATRAVRGFLMIDAATHDTVAAGLVRRAAPDAQRG